MCPNELLDLSAAPAATRERKCSTLNSASKIRTHTHNKQASKQASVCFLLFTRQLVHNNNPRKRTLLSARSSESASERKHNASRR